MTVVSVLLPTVGNRAGLLARVQLAHHATLDGIDHEILTVEGKTWGGGLNELIPQARGDYLLCACDDTLPHAGWFEAARAMLDTGQSPAARYFDQAGQPLRPGTDDAPHGTPIPWVRAFLLTPGIYRELGAFMDTTWYTDIDYSERLTASGRHIFACDGFTFTHLDGPRDWQTAEVAAAEEAAYRETHR